jgi:hypothetical protein
MDPRRSMDPWVKISIALMTSRIRIQNSEALEAQNRAAERPWTLTMESRRLKLEPSRVYRPLGADSHRFDDEQDPDPH